MEYPKKSINGDAGEYFVAYQITRQLGWPCRLYGVDLGVDAEIEIIDDSGRSTGDVIKVQIKSFDSIKKSQAKAVYVSDRHIDYWKRFCLPVIICCVDLSKEKIYWKQLTATEAYASNGAAMKIDFCLKHDLFDSSSKDKLNKLVAPDQSKRIDELFRDLDQLATNLPASTTGYADFTSISKTEDLCTEVTKIVTEIDELITHFPWRISTIALRKLNYIKEHIRATQINCYYYHNVLAEGG